MVTSKEVQLDNGNRIMVINYKGDGDPVYHINKFIKENMNVNEKYTEFVDMDMDNPWVRILVIGHDSKSVI